MKTFKDLVFKEHPNKHHFDTQAVIEFENGYGVSVITGFGAYCDSNTYEVAILKNGNLCYDTEITDDVIGYQTDKDITNIMLKVQNFK